MREGVGSVVLFLDATVQGETGERGVGSVVLFPDATVQGETGERRCRECSVISRCCLAGGLVREG